MTNAALNLPNSNTGDVRAGDFAGRDVVKEGVDAEPVIELLGERLADGLEGIRSVLFYFLAVTAFQTAVVLLVAIVVVAVLLRRPDLVAIVAGR